jgi:hypothetical protein
MDMNMAFGGKRSAAEHHPLSELADLYAYMPRKEVFYSINISWKHKYVYLENPKVACGHIKRSLQRLELEGTDVLVRNVHDRLESPLLMVYQVPAEQLLEIFNGTGFFKFSFVRNPFTRILSAYLDKILRNQRHKRSVLLALGRDPHDLEQFVSFEEFVRSLARLDPYHMDNHWRPQAQQLFMPRVRYDFVGRFERLDNDLAKVLGRIAGEAPSAVDRDVSYKTDAAAGISEYYDERIADLVRSVYAEDFRSFGYPLELPEDA